MLFVEKAIIDPNWAFVNILKFIQFHKAVERKKVTATQRSEAHPRGNPRRIPQMHDQG